MAVRGYIGIRSKYAEWFYRQFRIERVKGENDLKKEKGRRNWAALVVCEALLNVVPQYSSFLRR